MAGRKAINLFTVRGVFVARPNKIVTSLPVLHQSGVCASGVDKVRSN
jgi:hypothetical protein